MFDVPLPGQLRGKEEELTQYLENSLNLEGKKTYHVKITFDALEFNP